MVKTQHKAPFSLSALEEYDSQILLSSALFKKHNILISSDVFDEGGSAIDNLLMGKSALFVISEKIYELYGDLISNFLEERKSLYKTKLIVIETGEENKTLENVSKICQASSDFSLNRNHPIVGVGGGICLDMCGLAAALFRRGVPHIKIPTTLVGVIDAGIAVKNGVNAGLKKNLLGTFYPPEASIIDPTFLKTLPLREINCGIAESLKMGLIADYKLYQLWLDDGYELRHSCFQHPIDVSNEVIKRSILSMLQELSDNLYEHNTYQRAVDFGHSFSQYIEQTSNYQILHGEAVAIDMALSCQISFLKGLMDERQLNEVIELFKRLELPLYSAIIDADHLWASLSCVKAHRGGHLNLVIPKGIGQCIFLETLEDLSLTSLKEALVRLRNVSI
jgi:2-epi-5-epi-valiolone synthase